MDRTKRNLVIGYACALLVVLLWAGFIVMSRHASRGGGGGVRLTPWDLGALRYGVGGVVAAGLWLAGVGRGLPIWRGFVLAIFGAMLFAPAAYVGFSMSPATHSAVLMPGMLPFSVAFGSWLVFGDRFSPARLRSLGLVALGIVLIGIESYGYQAAPPGAWRGDLLFLLTSSAWAVFTILARRWSATPMQALVALGLWPVLLYLPTWWFLLPSHMAAVPPIEVMAQALVQGFLSMVCSVVLFTVALKLLGSARLTTVTALTPGVAALGAALVLHEPLGLLSILGLTLVCGAVMVGMTGAPAPVRAVA